MYCYLRARHPFCDVGLFHYPWLARRLCRLPFHFIICFGWPSHFSSLPDQSHPLSLFDVMIWLMAVHTHAQDGMPVLQQSNPTGVRGRGRFNEL